jgi:hypothetical protein
VIAEPQSEYSKVYLSIAKQVKEAIEKANSNVPKILVE